MYTIDVSLIKMITDHYWIKRDNIVQKIDFGGRVFFDKYERIDQPLNNSIIKDHLEGKITVAHSLINRFDKVENIVFDYNGRNTERFWHRAQLLLREEGLSILQPLKAKQKVTCICMFIKGTPHYKRGVKLLKCSQQSFRKSFHESGGCSRHKNFQKSLIF
jgi:hypothetical protein